MKALFLPLPLLLPGCLNEVVVGSNMPDLEDPTDLQVDLDEDGVTPDEGDCDDSDAEIGPAGSEDGCDGIDNNCDGTVDEGQCDREVWFTQTLQLDTLFVIDSSITMAPYLTRVAEGAEDFLVHLVGAPFDTHIGVVTMDSHDPDTQGELVTVDGRQFIAGDDPQFQGVAARTWLTRAITENATVSGYDPEGRASADAALTPHEGESWNQGFLRSAAQLQIVFITDREDGTVLPTVTGFLDHLEDPLVKGTLSKVTIHAITQLGELSCEGVDSPATEGASYVALVDSTAGTSLSVCEADYGPYLSAVGQFAATEGLETRIPLGDEAAAASVVVRLTLPDTLYQVDLPSDAFALADGNRTLILTGDPLPPAGTTIHVSFQAVP